MLSGLRLRTTPALAVISGVAIATALVVIASRRYPDVLRLSGADIVLAVTITALAGYAACGLWALRHDLAGRGIGLICGLTAGAMWSAEIWSGGPARFSHSVEQTVGGTFLVLAFAATVSAGVAGALHARRPDAAWQAGLFSGLVSGVFVYAFGVIMTLLTLPILASRSDYQAQFIHSGAPNMSTFLVGDILAALAAHLLINLVIGLAGGCLGAIIARSARPRGPATPLLS